MKLRTLAFSLLASFSMPAGARLDVGAVPPDALGKTPQNEEIKISQFRGTVVVVTFWASWCGPCRKELPVLDVLQKGAGDRVRIIAVNVKDSREDYKIMRGQMKDASITFTHDMRGKIADGFDVKAYPNLFVIDQAGRIAAVHVGFSEKSLGHIIDDIEKLLAKPPTPVAAQ
jgi:thiol-disulfide isomerase/thioredoxin